MCRNKEDALGTVEGDFQQVAGVESQNGSAVGGDIAYLGQSALNLFRRFKIGGKDQVVHFTQPPVFFIDIADLGRQHKTRLTRWCGKRQAVGLRPELFFKAEQTFFGRLQLFFQFLQPARMGEVAAAHHGDALDPGPVIQIFGNELFAGGDGIMRMDMQIGDKFHEPGNSPYLFSCALSSGCSG